MEKARKLKHHSKHSFSKEKKTPYNTKNLVLYASKNNINIVKNKKIDPNKVYKNK